VLDERHNSTRNLDWHLWAHDTIGCRYESGLLMTHNSGTKTAATFAVETGNIHDEDIDFTVPASSAFPTPHTCRLFWQTGANSYAFDNTPSTTPYKRGTSDRPVYINSASSYAITTLADASNRYINFFFYAAPDEHTPIYCFAETATPTIIGTYTNPTNTRAALWPNLANLGFAPELRPIYRLIVRADGVVQAFIAADDYRTVSSLPMAAGTNATTATAVSLDTVPNLAATNVQSAIEEIFSVRRETKFFTASAFTPAITNGAIAGNEETTTYKRNYDYLAFKGVDNDTSAEVKFRMPEDWDLSTIKVKVDWGIATGASASDVQFELSAGAIRNASSMDYDLGTVVDLVDTVIAVGDLHQTDASGAITVGGTPAKGDLITMKIARDYNHVTVPEDVKVYGVILEYGALPASPTAW
jgi:hypothetical protein